jgi:hypothetical protein
LTDVSEILAASIIILVVNLVSLIMCPIKLLKFANCLILASAATFDVLSEVMLSRRAQSSTNNALMMEALSASETSVNFYKTAPCRIPRRLPSSARTVRSLNSISMYPEYNTGALAVQQAAR